MKKLAVFLLIVLALASCARKKYTGFSVKPVLPRMTLAAGQESFIAIKVELPGSDHIYGNPKGPGIGEPTVVTAAGQSPFIFSAARFLPPEKYTDSIQKNFVWIYRGDTYIFLPVRVPADARPGSYIVKLRFSAVLCDENTCTNKETEWDYPVVIDSAGALSAYSPDIRKLYAESRAPEGSAAKDEGNKDAPGSATRHFTGISFSPVYYEQGIAGLVQAILLGILAGLFLNFMPCVLPVVSLKVLSFVQNASNDRGTLIKLGATFSLGILSSFLVLASLAAFLGHSWGDLFQDRWFILVMAGIVFALALSLFGVFQLNMPAFAGKAASGRGGTYTDAFVKGLLATLLATPCSGPFLGGTLAWALTRSPGVIFAIFMSVGLGMALPYLALTARPALLRFVPKPGEWMASFEKIMGFFLVFTVIYLLGILDRESLMPALVFLGFLAVGLWQYGQFGSLVQPRVKRVISLVVLIVLCASGYFLSFEYLFKPASSGSAPVNFTAERLFANRDSGRISVVKFTADWCPNCRLVEKTSLHTEKVIAVLQARGIDLLTADITKKNPPARELMDLLGTKSIPFLAVFPAGNRFTRPVCLRDIYSEKDVLKAIEDAGKN